MQLPVSFLGRMQQLLGEEYDAFEAALAQPPALGLRVNTLKIAPQDFLDLSPFSLAALPWSTAGFQIHTGPGEEVPPGKHPYHAAGLYYLQDPSAMAVAEILNPQPGQRVLDISAAPGGKATHLAALLQGQGVLVANEVHPGRVWDLAENLERWGAHNTAITNESPERLASQLDPCFDKILVDAPCSGEGLFRRQPEARRAWNETLVESCALRQGRILDSAAALLRPGGILVYSTCTFAPEENEGALARFLERHPEFAILPISHRPGFAPGRPDWLPYVAPDELAGTVRIWPHQGPGEGHFIAQLQKSPGPGATARVEAGMRPRATREATHLFYQFVRKHLNLFAAEPTLHLAGTYLYQIPPDLPELSSLRTIHPGWWLGTIKKSRFEPSHGLAMALQPEEARRCLNLDGKDVAAIRNYLSGGTLAAGNLGDGWVLIAVDGFALGWGKNVQGIIKNAYPRGLRWP